MFHRLWIKSIKEQFFSLSTQYVKISTKIVHRSSIISQRSWNINSNMSQHVHCVKSLQIRSFSWSVFSCIQSEYRKIRTKKKLRIWALSKSPYSVRIQENTDQTKIRIWTLFTQWCQLSIYVNLLRHTHIVLSIF